MMSLHSISETLHTRVIGDYEVVVAGGGAAGLVAALAAAREGARTALIERTSCLGGTATAGMVAQWLGFYNREMRVVGGLAMDLARRVCGLGGSDGFARSWAMARPRLPELARAGSHPGRRRGPLSGVDLPPERWA
jgi:phytoene dehydrogenase-like protein